ncbi:ATP-binding protein [Staphylococcus phage vB_StaM_PB50]|nr:ATP-binding protein [Staphylococcus phage vB_StaM_PB50]
MSVTKYSDVKLVAKLNFEADNLVNIIGHGGIGKTQLFKEIAREENMNFITIAANNLKEGELSMPMLSPKDNEVVYAPMDKIKEANRLYEAYKEYQANGGVQYSQRDLANMKLDELKEIYKDLSKEDNLVEYYEDTQENYVNKVFNKAKVKNVKYTHAELRNKSVPELEEIFKELTGKELKDKLGKGYYISKVLELIPRPYTLLFVDEIARTDQQVQSELMNFLLERQVNGYYLPDNVKIALAQNPSSDMPGFEDTDYSSTSMDNAVSSRLLHIHMEPDMTSFVQYATQYKPDSEKQNIHPSVLEFITEKESYEYLFNPNKEANVDFNDTNPRSWEMLSNLVYTIEDSDLLKTGSPEENRRNKQKALQISAEGKINMSLANKFTKFYIDNQAKLPRPSDILFEYDRGVMTPRKELLKQHIEVIEGQSTIRQLTLKTAIINYLKNNPDLIDEKVIQVAVEALLLGKTETNATSVRLISRLSESTEDTDQILYDKFTDNDLYSDEAFKLYEKMTGSLG